MGDSTRPIDEVGCITVGPGGWSIHFRPTEGCSSHTLSGYGDDFTDYVTGVLGPRRHPGYSKVMPDGRTKWEHDMDRIRVPDDVLVIDCRPMAEDDQYTFVISGPMVGLHLEPGMVHAPLGNGGNPRFPWDPTPNPERPEHCAKLGNTRSLSYVAPDVLAAICESMGGVVHTVRSLRKLLAVWA